MFILPRNPKAWRGFWLRLGGLGLALLLGALYLWYSALRMPGVSHAGALPPLSAEEIEIREALRAHVEKLSGAIGERHLARDAALRQAENYLRDTLEGLGYAVTLQSFAVQEQTARNLVATLAGRGPGREQIVVGAHYDSAEGSPGANDNASGAAALLEIARRLAGSRPARSVRLVAFVNEEPPYFAGEYMGSAVYARQARQAGENIVAMLSLETIGYYSDAPGSQDYPVPLLRWFYPDAGDFIGFVGNTASAPLVRRCLESFRRETAFPAEGIAAPNWVPGIAWSDHQSFWGQGYPALMVTDTAPFRYPYYHTAQDTADKLDYDRAARVVLGLSKLVGELATFPGTLK